MSHQASRTDETVLPEAVSAGLGTLRFLHPAGTFALTPASRIALEAIGQHQALLSGIGLDWGSGAGCLAIAAARIAQVQKVIGLEIEAANVAVARENARLNRVDDRTVFLLADSYAPVSPADRATLDEVAGRVDFILANPPSSDGDDGFGYRRVVLWGAKPFLVENGVVFLSVSSQYGPERVKRLCQEVPGFVHGGILASTDWVPFDLSRPDLLQCLQLYAAEERRGGLEYTFMKPGAGKEERMNAQGAYVHFERTGESPWSKWQSHLFHYRPA